MTTTVARTAASLAVVAALGTAAAIPATAASAHRTPRATSVTQSVLPPTAVPALRGPAAYTFMIECGMEVTSRPRQFLLACADGNAYLDKLSWRRWGRSSATATGVLTVNTCRPTCAQGTFRDYRVRVTASHLVHKEANQVYSRLRVRFVTKRPAEFPRTFVERLPTTTW